MNASVISMITELEKRSYAETGLCREYYNGKRFPSLLSTLTDGVSL